MSKHNPPKITLLQTVLLRVYVAPLSPSSLPWFFTLLIEWEHYTLEDLEPFHSLLRFAPKLCFKPNGILYSVPPSPPLLSYTDGSVCFWSEHAATIESYLVNVTDTTGNHTALSGTYTTPQCLNITSDLYPDLCEPLTVSVIAVNRVGQSNVTELNTTGCSIEG